MHRLVSKDLLSSDVWPSLDHCKRWETCMLSPRSVHGQKAGVGSCKFCFNRQLQLLGTTLLASAC